MEEDAATAVSGTVSVTASLVMPKVGTAVSGGGLFANSSIVKAKVDMARIMPKKIRIAFFRGLRDELSFILLYLFRQTFFWSFFVVCS